MLIDRAQEGGGAIIHSKSVVGGGVGEGWSDRTCTDAHGGVAGGGARKRGRYASMIESKL